MVYVDEAAAILGLVRNERASRTDWEGVESRGGEGREGGRVKSGGGTGYGKGREGREDRLRE